MNLDDLFPIGLVSQRTRFAILCEFQGRCPSIREMTHIPDKQWLATPGIGSTTLKSIRYVTNGHSPLANVSPQAGMTAEELLQRLLFVQEELCHLSNILKVRTGRSSTNEARA